MIKKVVLCSAIVLSLLASTLAHANTNVIEVQSTQTVDLFGEQSLVSSLDQTIDNVQKLYDSGTLNQTSLAEVTVKLLALEERLNKYGVEDSTDVLTVLGKALMFGENLNLLDKSKVFVGEVYAEKVKIIQKSEGLSSDAYWGYLGPNAKVRPAPIPQMIPFNVNYLEDGNIYGDPNYDQSAIARHNLETYGTPVTSNVASVLKVVPNSLPNSLSNLKPVRAYLNGMFKDVNVTDWFAKDVETAYKYGLVSGMSEGVFSPKGNLTLAEALSIASRVHNIYHGGDGVIPKAGNTWYAGAYNYSVDNLIIDSDDFTDLTRNATRAEMAYIFANVLDQKDLSAINNIKTLPDLDTSMQYADSIMKLYNAGIISGSDDYGTFRPTASVTRGESVAIIKRVILQSERRVFTLKQENATAPILTPTPVTSAPVISKYDAAQVAKGVTPLYGMHSYGSQSQKEYDYVMQKIAEIKKTHNVETYNFAGDASWNRYYTVKSGGGTDREKMWIKQWAYVNVINEFGEQKAKELYIIMGLTSRLITGTLTNVGESAYEQLTTGADCNGLAHLDSAVWDSFGYSTRILAGNSHAWTQIKLSDGKWHDGSGLNVGNQTTSTKHTDVAFVLVQPTY